MPLDLFDPAVVKQQTTHVDGQLGTPLMSVDVGEGGVWVALVDEAGDFTAAVKDLTARMLSDAAPSGVLILSQPLAARMFGPVPQDVLEAGITMQRSQYRDLLTGGYAFLHDYLAMMERMDQSLVELDLIAATNPQSG